MVRHRRIWEPCGLVSLRTDFGVGIIYSRKLILISDVAPPPTPTTIECIIGERRHRLKTMTVQ